MRISNDTSSKDDRLTAISVAGFKSISCEQTLYIAPLTILAGANSSGKSSMMQPLLLMKQTLEAPYDPGVFLLDGPNVRFTKSDQILSFDRSDISSIFKVTLHSIFGAVGTSYVGNDVNSFDIHSVEYFSSFLKK